MTRPPTPRRRPSTACSQAGVNVIIGAASSGVSQTVIDTVTGAGVMQISPANTSDNFTTYDDNGLYFRTAPPDVLQARALADLILEDGNNTVGILALNDPYGTGLAENTRNNLLDGGLGEEDVPSRSSTTRRRRTSTPRSSRWSTSTPTRSSSSGSRSPRRSSPALNAEGIGPQR